MMTTNVFETQRCLGVRSLFWEHIEADCVHYVRGYIDAVYGVTSPNGKRSERDHGRNRVPSQGS